MGAGRGDQEASWVGTTTASKPMVVCLTLVLVATFVIVSIDGGWLAATGYAALLTLALVTFMHARIGIDRQGVEFRFGPWGWPRMSRRLEDIESVTTRRVEWWRYGLGFRWIPHGWAVVPRSGDAVEVGLKGGRRLVFTTDEADVAARRLNGLLEGERGRS